MPSADYLILPAGNPGPYTGKGNNTYLLPGREPTLVDAGVGEPSHLSALEQALDGADLARVVVTHGHRDHIAGVEGIAARWPRARFCKMPWARDTPYGVRWEPLADNDLVRVGDGNLALRVVHTPGHAPDHICLFIEETGELFAGDLVVAGTTVVISPRAGGNMAAYLQSLARVRALGPRRFLPAHGPVIDDPQTVLDRYIEHRRSRERSIVQTLESGPKTPVEIVGAVYGGLRPDLAGAATETVHAHLIKLEAERRVRPLGERYALTAARDIS